MKQPPKTPDTKETTREDELFSEMFSCFFEVRDDDWSTQTRRLRDISKLALKLVDVIEGVEEE